MMAKVKVVLFMVVSAAIATAAMTGTKILLGDRIRRNERLAEHRERLRAFGLLEDKADAAAIEARYAARVREVKHDGRTLYVAYDDDARKSVRAIGFDCRGMGLWGPIEGFIALDAELRKMVGFAVMSHQETPGLGGRMTDAWFRDQFRDKPVDQPDERGRYFVFVPETTSIGEGGREVHAISGATNTTMGVAEMLDREISRFRKDMEGVSLESIVGSE